MMTAARRTTARSASIGLMSFASAVAVANIYYNQPMLADMSRALGVESHKIGWVATATQIGYACGMPLFIPLGDIVERRKLVVGLFLLVACALALTASSSTLLLVVAGSFCIGVTSIIAQVLIPLASDLSPPGNAGRTIGAMQSGVLLGILLARTLSGVVAQHFGWRAMFYLACALALSMAVLLRLSLPELFPKPGASYAVVMRSIWQMVKTTPKLRQVCIVAALFMASFSAFWTTLVFFLERPPYHYGSQTAGLFGLVGAVGAGVAPLSGRWSDRRSPRFVVKIAIGAVLISFAIFSAFGSVITGLVLGVILLDAGVQAAQVANQSRVMSLRPEARNRVNTIYMITYFAGGSLGSLAGSALWSKWGWAGVCGTGIACMLLATAVLLARVPDAP